MQIIDKRLKFAYPLSSFASVPTLIVLHHEAGSGSVEDVHRYHLSLGWAGIAYHLYVRKDGTVYKGRPLDKVGGHTAGYNAGSIGVCCEGNFEKEQMTGTQKQALKEAVEYVKQFFPAAKVVGHRELMATACPGKNFPLDWVKEETMNGFEINEKLSEHRAEMPESEWSKEEGFFGKATEHGVMDGSAPQGYLTREQFAAVLGRLGLLDDGKRESGLLSEE